MTIPYIMSSMNMYMCRFPTYMPCYICKTECDRKDMSVDPLSDNTHHLVCQKCKEYGLQWIKKNEPKKNRGSKCVEPRPIDQFWNTEYKSFNS